MPRCWTATLLPRWDSEQAASVDSALDRRRMGLTEGSGEATEPGWRRSRAADLPRQV